MSTCAASSASGVPGVTAAPGLSPALSDAIRVMRLPLMLGPLLVHACLAPQSSLLQFILARVIGDISVPAFFLLSGLLYFATFDGTARGYMCKLRNRIWSLVIPYVLWNLIGYFVLAWVVPCVAKGDFLRSFWRVRVAYRSVSTAPVDGPLYFIKGLVFLALAAPAIHWGLRRRWLAWLAPAGAAFWAVAPVAALADRMFVVAAALFSLGGFLTVRSPNALAKLVTSRRAAIAAVLAFLFAAVSTVALHVCGHDCAVVRRIMILLGIPAWFAVAGALSRCSAAPLLRRSHGFAMFLFCSFDLILVASRKEFHHLRAASDAMCAGMALGTLAVSLGLYLLLYYAARPLLRLLTGDRK